MEVWIGGEIESSILNDFRAARCELQKELSEYLLNKTYEVDLESLDCIAIIRDDSEFEEIHGFSAKEREMDFRLVIQFDDFLLANLNGRKQLILNMLFRALDLLIEKHSCQEAGFNKLKNDLATFNDS